MASKIEQHEVGKFVPKEEDVLQRHVAFFDRNHDGIVYPWETFQGFRAIGCGFILSTAAAFLVNMKMSSKTRQGRLPNPLFPIVVKNIHKAKHGSDSGAYDSEGRFVPSKFEEIFSKHARTHQNALTSDEVKAMLKANREPRDLQGWFSSFTEWKLLHYLCKDKNGLLQKDTVRAIYDGSLFERLEKERGTTKKKGFSLFSFLFFVILLASFALSSISKPEGVGKFVPNEEDVLQRHVAFFDRNHDGIVYPWETFQGFKAIGSGVVVSTVAAFLVNMKIGPQTRPGRFPNPLFPIEVKNIHKAKHGSDSGVYNSEGRFVPSKFEEIFSKHARTHQNALTSDEITAMRKANREPNDRQGWFSSFTEWTLLNYLGKDKNGLLQKDTVRSVYDGSLFERLEKERESAKKKA
ncbi:uncharacterized protein LOC123213650 [Mangifera indica]|uniref:uncharacterized protein LOC123213650 n=1 Tax=Mangifera indica TaxID=29780 RepID=UPI001CFB39D7|nr:uncharacterized protein LOC123213650 [Mangifera indica]